VCFRLLFFAIDAHVFNRLHSSETMAWKRSSVRSPPGPPQLHGADARSSLLLFCLLSGVCVTDCGRTRRSDACGKGFRRCTLGFPANVAVPLQQLAAGVSGNRHDRAVCRPTQFHATAGLKRQNFPIPVKISFRRDQFPSFRLRALRPIG